MENETSLAKVAYTLPPGSMVYLKKEDTFYLKTENTDNVWRIIQIVRKTFNILRSCFHLRY